MTAHTPLPLEMLVRSIVATLDDYGFPDDQPANYRNDRSIALMALKDFHSEAKKLINATDSNNHQILVDALQCAEQVLSAIECTGEKSLATGQVLDAVRHALNQSKL